MSNRLPLSPKHQRILEALLREHLHDVEVWAYGSRVNGRGHEGSDLDLVLRGPGLRQIPLDQLVDFEDAVRESNIPFLVEARDWTRLPKRFHREIKGGYVVLYQSDERKGSRGWLRLRLGDCMELGDESYRTTDDWAFVNYLDTGSIKEGRVSAVKHLVVGEDKIPSRARRKVRYGDIVYSTVRPNQRHFGLLKEIPPNFLVSTGFCVMRGHPSLVDTRFLYWFLAQDRVIDHLQTIAEHSVSAYPSIRPSDIESLEIRLPCMAEQRTIAHILGTLDDKIELNRRMNATLEVMTRALFKSWFVDFEPVRAKMEGRDTGLPKHIADLFPSRLVDSELGEVPKGWTVGALGDIAVSRTRGIDPAHVAGDTPYIGLQHMPRRSVALTDWGVAGNVSSRKSAFAAGDILFGKLRPYFHKVGIAALDGICSTDIVVLNARKPKWSAFVLACVSSSDFVAHTSQTSTGTKMPRTSWQVMSIYKLCRPTDAIASKFQHVVSPILGQIVRNVRESRTLAVFRDTLLPKLISGELRVKQLEIKTL